MLFNSLEYLVFFPTVVMLYFAIPYRYRWAFLLAASYYFYACWKVEYLVLILFSTLVDYYVGLRLDATQDHPKRRWLLSLSIFSNIGLLFAFKYFNFFSEATRALFSHFNIFYDVPHFNVLLPIGISFYTFQSLSYSIDVYRGRRPAEKHLGIFALYVSFFPQLVAGPIERSTHLLPQFRETKVFDPIKAKEGLFLILLGYFKKLVIADRVAIYADQVFNQPQSFEGIQIVTAAYLFGFQLYCDFSAYSDIAIGSAKIMGYDLMENFRRPFAARTLREFWQRWHISLTRWMMDYLYLPLSKKLSGRSGRAMATCIVFLIVGLWHGAAWNFVLFGICVGLALVFGDVTRPARKKVTQTLFPRNKRVPVVLHHTLKVVIIFHLYIMGCIIFRVNSIPDLMVIIQKLTGSINLSLNALVLPSFSLYELVLAGLSILFLEIWQWFQHKQEMHYRMTHSPLVIQWTTIYAFIFGIMMFGEFQLRPFIYFQF